MKVFQKQSENPFYGKEGLFALYSAAEERGKKTIDFDMLDKVYKECKNDTVLLGGFLSLLFNIGDITDRQHNIFRNASVDGGGKAMRDEFFLIRNWLESRMPVLYYNKLQRLIVEYSGWDALLASRVRTKKKSNTVIKVVSALQHADLNKLAEFIASYIKQEKDPMRLSLLAKRLVRIDNRKRKLSPSVDNRRLLSTLYDALSMQMDWEIVHKEGYFIHKGLLNWKKQYTTNLESVLFSTKKVQDFDLVLFSEWLSALPSDARRRVSRRLKNPKWAKLAVFHEFWEKEKEKLQAERRALEEKKEQGHQIDDAKLQELTKASRVTTGATNLKDELELLLTGKGDARDFNLRADSILKKVKFAVPVLPILDVSTSMKGSVHNLFLAYDLSALMGTIIGLVNPSKEGLLVTFGSTASVYSYKASVMISQNRFMEGNKVIYNNLIDPKETFLANYNRMRNVAKPVSGATLLTSISNMFKEWATTPERKEIISEYPVFLVMTDAHFNNAEDAKRSVDVFMTEMRSHFGWNGVLVIWDVQSQGKSRFPATNNVIHITDWTPSAIDSVFRNLGDLDVIDEYLPIWTLARSNRYAPVRNILG